MSAAAQIPFEIVGELDTPEGPRLLGITADQRIAWLQPLPEGPLKTLHNPVTLATALATAERVGAADPAFLANPNTVLVLAGALLAMESRLMRPRAAIPEGMTP